jgi:hypothetical protein
LPAQRTKFSKWQLTQLQLLAVLCLMRYENWTFREAEVRFGESTELQSALELNSVLDYTTLYRFLARLDPADVARVMNEIVRRRQLPQLKRHTEADSPLLWFRNALNRRQRGKRFTHLSWTKHLIRLRAATQIKKRPLTQI